MQKLQELTCINPTRCANFSKNCHLFPQYFTATFFWMPFTQKVLLINIVTDFPTAGYFTSYSQYK